MQICQRQIRELGGSGACSPVKFLKFECEVMQSGGIFLKEYGLNYRGKMTSIFFELHSILQFYKLIIKPQGQIIKENLQ